MIAHRHSKPPIAIASRPATRALLEAACIAALALGTHAAYRASSSTVQLCDSTYSLVVSEQFLASGSFDIRDRIPTDERTRRAMPGCSGNQDLPYHLVRKPDPNAPNGSPRIFYGYPLGSSLLSIPFVWNYALRKGLSSLGPDGAPNYEREGILQQRIASTVAAGIAVLFFFIARQYCNLAASLFIAAGFAFGSPLWSTMSRALWSHTWMAFCLSAAILMLVLLRRVKCPTWKLDIAFGCGLGTALFWAVCCRQHAAISAAAIGISLLAQHRRVLFTTSIAGGAWSAAFAVISLSQFGTPLPPSVYSSGAIDFRDVPFRFAGLMVSPSRGLIVFCPYLVVVAAILLARRKFLRDAALLLPALFAVGAHTALFSAYNGWHGNWAYGPRYFCDVLPWFVLLTAMSMQSLGAAPPRGKAIALVLLALGFAWGGFVHFRGANSKAAWHWNDLTRTLGDEGAVTNWRYPQFLAGLTFTVNDDGTVNENPHVK